MKGLRSFCPSLILFWFWNLFSLLLILPMKKLISFKILLKNLLLSFWSSSESICSNVAIWLFSPIFVVRTGWDRWYWRKFLLWSWFIELRFCLIGPKKNYLIKGNFKKFWKEKIFFSKNKITKFSSQKNFFSFCNFWDKKFLMKFFFFGRTKNSRKNSYFDQDTRDL